MVTAISNATPTQPVAQATKTSAQKPARSESKSAPQTDTIQQSQTAQAALAALQEASETPAQTAKEAGNGDRQAQALLAREAAGKRVSK